MRPICDVPECRVQILPSLWILLMSSMLMSPIQYQQPQVSDWQPMPPTSCKGTIVPVPTTVLFHCIINKLFQFLPFWISSVGNISFPQFIFHLPLSESTIMMMRLLPPFVSWEGRTVQRGVCDKSTLLNYLHICSDSFQMCLSACEQNIHLATRRRRHYSPNFASIAIHHQNETLSWYEYTK